MFFFSFFRKKLNSSNVHSWKLLEIPEMCTADSLKCVQLADILKFQKCAQLEILWKFWNMLTKFEMFLKKMHMISNWKVGGCLRVAIWSSYPPLCDLTLKWSNFFPIDQISGLEKYVMVQHQVCLFSRKFFWLCLFSTILTKKQQFLVIFQAK